MSKDILIDIENKCRDILYIPQPIIDHVIGYYKGIGKHRQYLHESTLYDIIMDVLTNVMIRLLSIKPNRLRTRLCIYWPVHFETGHPVNGSTGLGTLDSHKYTDEVIIKYKSILDHYFYHVYVYPYVNPYEQCYHDIFNLFYHW